MKQAAFYERIKDDHVKCLLCNHYCIISPDKRGLCGVRQNKGGTLYSLTYGKPAALNVDPIEKKPLYHFYPASHSFSIATVGCNFRCRHCQNFSISQVDRETLTFYHSIDYPPEKIVQEAIRHNCLSISYTYTEPTVYFEYALDIAKLAKSEGLKNVFVSNGYTSAEATTAITPYLDANNIDLKGDEDFYRRICGAKLQPVLDTIKRMKDAGVWVEITTLIIPTLNDNEEFINWASEFIKSVDPSIPWHLSAFHPTYKMTDKPPTPAETLRKARLMAIQSGLRYVYTGNLRGDEGEHTYCPNCNRLIIERRGFYVGEINISERKCVYCGFSIDGVGLP